jgi:two-component system, OmpR family, sensor histidine kinase CiaH
VNKPRLHRVRAAATRVALVTTGIVAIVYLVIAGIVSLIVARNLTSDIDARLTSSLSRIANNPKRLPTTFRPPPSDSPRFGAPLLVWSVLPTGTVIANDTSAVLPVAERNVSGPTTVSVGGTDVRIAGTQVGDNHVVVGQSMDSVAQARQTLILAEVLVGPVLLSIVFMGALTIGRRVAAPIELAHQRQMEFTADASHELRTPLSVIEAQTTLALQQEREPAWYRRAFERVDVESKRIRRLVDDLLWLARFDSTDKAPHAEHVDLGVLAYQAADRFGAVAEARQLSLTVQLRGGSHVVTAPPEWLDRLIGVLLDNACKYTTEPGSVAVTVAEEGSRVRLTVDDSGPGIPIEERPRIFDRFHRATDAAGGAGLGLAIADAVVKRTGGRWDLGTSAAGGASMAVSWPRGLAGRRDPVAPAQPLPEAPSST